MKKNILPGSVIALSLMGAFNQAQAGVFVGVTFNFDAKGVEGLGFTTKVTSTNKRDRFAASAGATYFPFKQDNQFGLDAGVGYQGNNSAGIVSWDFLQKGVSVSAGYAKTKKPAVLTVPPAGGAGAGGGDGAS
ncbi:MAG: hypothetical protein GXP22_03395 [Gammaproteobacteria bacterium]|nr:hypothetical protein [Gammaproteobacteria bacterium]